jgi:hypothetical protein
VKRYSELTDYGRNFMTTNCAYQLAALMHQAQQQGWSFSTALAEGRRKFNKEVRETVDATPLPK